MIFSSDEGTKREPGMNGGFTRSIPFGKVGGNVLRLDVAIDMSYMSSIGNQLRLSHEEEATLVHKLVTEAGEAVRKAAHEELRSSGYQIYEKGWE